MRSGGEISLGWNRRGCLGPVVPLPRGAEFAGVLLGSVTDRVHRVADRLAEFGELYSTRTGVGDALDGAASGTAVA